MREALGIMPDLAGVVAGLLARRPQSGAGVLGVGQARDPGHAGDQRPPRCVQLTGGVEDLDAPMLLAAMAAAVHRLVAAEGALLGAELGQGSMQVGLVVLDADQQGIAGFSSPREPLSLAM